MLNFRRMLREEQPDNPTRILAFKHERSDEVHAVLEKENKVRLAELGERATELKDDAVVAMKQLGAPIEAGIASAMRKLGVPTRTEIVNLTKRVEELTKAVAKAKTDAQSTAAKPAAKRPATKSKSAGNQA